MGALLPDGLNQAKNRQTIVEFFNKIGQKRPLGIQGSWMKSRRSP
jgi:hypothetical protein